MNNKPLWKSILEDVNINQRLELIANSLNNISLDKGLSLMGGNTGVALFLYYYWLFKKDDIYLEKANKLILNNFKFKTAIDSFCHGNAGFMWAIDHLIGNNFIEGKCDELFLDKEPILNLKMEKEMQDGKYDFLHNALGIGFYFLKRNNNQSIMHINSLLNALEKIAVKDKILLKWRSFNLKENNDVYNLSMSHGIASIIVFLSKAYKIDVLRSKAEELLYGAVSFLLKCKFDVPNTVNGSYFPPYLLINDENNNSVGSRLAWCYGDLGIGVALWQASQVLHNTEWEKIAVEVLMQTTSRRNPQKEFVVDAGICHGSSGIAHIYNRMYQYTGINEFKDSAIYWLRDTLNKDVFPDGLAGYKVWRMQKDGGWINEIGILEGISGIGLVLLSAISNTEPNWDECFLLS